jgi:hypothetical protein
MKEKTRALPLYWFKDIFPSDTHLVRSLPQATDRDCYNLSSIFLLYRVTKLLFPRADPHLRSIYEERKGPEKPRCTFNFSASVGDRFIATHDYGVSDLGRRTSFFLSFFLSCSQKEKKNGRDPYAGLAATATETRCAVTLCEFLINGVKVTSRITSIL